MRPIKSLNIRFVIREHRLLGVWLVYLRLAFISRSLLPLLTYRASHEPEKRGHADCDTICHLIGDNRDLGIISQLGRDFDSSVHRARVEHGHIWLRYIELGFVYPEEPGILANAWKERGILPFQLDTQNVDYIGSFQPCSQI